MLLSRQFGCVALLFVICFGVLTGCAPQEIPPHAEWRTFRTDNGKITAMFPFTPIEETQVEATVLGMLNVKLVGYESRDEALLLSYVTYPADPSLFDVDACLEACCTGAFPNGTFLEKSDRELSGYPGKASLVRDEGDMYARTHICLDPAGPTLVQLMCVGSLEFVNGSDARFFLDSVTVE